MFQRPEEPIMRDLSVTPTTHFGPGMSSSRFRASHGRTREFADVLLQLLWNGAGTTNCHS